jgi:uncharacterized protein YdhG (YjbR/CyaY superfamily)
VKKGLQYSGVDEYLALCEPGVREKLEQIRRTIQKAAPGSEEKISYMMPTFFNNGVLVHYAAFAKHIGFFPGASGVEAFLDRLGDLDTSKGTIRIPFDKPLPLDLISDIVKFRLEENRYKAELRRTKKK